MGALIHLFIKLIYIAILSVLYASLIIGFILLIQRILFKKPLLHINTKPFIIRYIVLTSIIYISLFLFMISHWGDRGLADYARLPLQHKKKVVQIDGSSTYLEDKEGHQIGISDFFYDNNCLYAKIDNQYKEGEYVVWKLENATWEIILTKDEYSEKGYPTEDNFKNFHQHYYERWSGWKFWLLP